MQPLSIDCRSLYRHILEVGQGTRAKGDGKPIYTVEQSLTKVYFRPTATRIENTPNGLVRNEYIPAVCYDDIKIGDCLGSLTDRLYKVTAVNEIPMSGGQRQIELKSLCPLTQPR